uniref:Uncharacterized protein n=1 Tax=Rhizophora mucronata TaxID=61149 RepID=A0A2P2KXF0_RHIMU
MKQFELSLPSSFSFIFWVPKQPTALTLQKLW